MLFGTEIHQILEWIDFKNPNLEDLNISDYVKRKIMKFLTSDLIEKNRNSKIYKEYEFVTKKGKNKLYGIIDLMIENDEEIIIIDYKLKNIEDKYYDQQLNGYRKHIKGLTNKKVSIYLYSMIDEKFREVEIKEVLI